MATVEARQTRYGTRVRATGPQLPVDARWAGGDAAGTRATEDVRRFLAAWVAAVERVAPTLSGALCGPGGARRCSHSSCAAIARRRAPGRDVTAQVRYLVGHVQVLSGSAAAVECLEAATALERRLVRLVDRPPDRWYAGVCGVELATHDAAVCACACHLGEDEASCDMPAGCGREYDVDGLTVCSRVLYVAPGEHWVRCRDCGVMHSVDRRREELLAEAVDREATVETITRVATTLTGWDVSAGRLSARIRQWAQRGKIEAHGTRVVDGRPAWWMTRHPTTSGAGWSPSRPQAAASRSSILTDRRRGERCLRGGRGA